MQSAIQPAYYPNQFYVPISRAIKTSPNSEKNLTQLDISLYASMIIIAMNGLFLILFPKYIINHIHSPGLPGIVQALIYIILISDLIYGLVVYFVAVSTEEQYHIMRTPMIIIGFSYLGFHLLLICFIF